MNNFKNILVVRTDRIGDVILTTPSLKKLRELYPESKITLMVSSLTKDLLKGNPYIDGIIEDDQNRKNKGFFGFIKFLYLLKKNRYDLAIIFHTKKRTNALCYLAQIPVRLGYKNNKFGFLLTHPIFDVRVQGNRHESQYCLDVLNYIPGVSTQKTEENLEAIGFDLYVAQDEDSDYWADILFEQEGLSSEKGVIAIHAGASDTEKRCSAPFFADLIESLIDRYNTKILLIGASYIKDVSIKILSEIKEVYKEDIIDLVGLTSLMQVVSLLRKTSLLISNDSGPVHLASALKIPVISLFIRNKPGVNPERWYPLGKKSKYLSVAKQKILPKGSSRYKSLILTEFENPQWQDFISKDRILEAVDSLFKL